MARIMLFGYIADLSTGSSDIQGAAQHADSLLLHLKNNRVGPEQQKRPLVFLGHSLGGIIIKKACLLTSRGPRADRFLGFGHELPPVINRPDFTSHEADRISRYAASRESLTRQACFEPVFIRNEDGQ